ncbi:MAG: tRNA1(Val) (adenine(37)-N6)-methyltransferase [Oscillospiraceae bacterium]
MSENYEKLNIGEKINIFVSEEHKFGTDAFILASFAKVKYKDTVCDLGTGCGIIPFIIANKYKPNKIIGVDIQKKAIEQFEKSIENSKVDCDIVPVLGDIKNISKKLGKEVFDVAVCNPPYKINETGLKNKNSAHVIARHEVLCDIYDICKTASEILKFSGKFYICQRPERFLDVIDAMKKNDIEPKEVRFVSKTVKSSPWLFVIEGRKKAGKNFKILSPLIVYDGDNYTDEMMDIYK